MTCLKRDRCETEELGSERGTFNERCLSGREDLILRALKMSCLAKAGRGTGLRRRHKLVIISRRKKKQENSSKKGKG